MRKFAKISAVLAAMVLALAFASLMTTTMMCLAQHWVLAEQKKRTGFL